jgi:folate-dependent phosphoribosylglycinamide formyltransferase PurN
LTNEQLEELSGKIAYITINPRGNFLKSAQVGFRDVGLAPKHLIYVKPTDRLKKEFKKYKLSFFKEFLLPQFKKFSGNKKSFSQEEVNIPIPNTISVSKLNSDETIAQIKKAGIKYLINCGAGIFRKRVIEIEGLTILNAHAGRLPMFKNMNVVEWAICNEEKVYGTIHQIDTGIDSGPVWLEEEIDVSGQKTLLDAREHSFDHVIRMAGKAVMLNEEGKITPHQHDPNEGKKWYRMHSYYQNKVEQLLNKK